MYYFSLLTYFCPPLCRVWYYSRFQTSTGGSWNIFPEDKRDYKHIFKKKLLKVWCTPGSWITWGIYVPLPPSYLSDLYEKLEEYTNWVFLLLFHILLFHFILLLHVKHLVLNVNPCHKYKKLKDRFVVASSILNE